MDFKSEMADIMRCGFYSSEERASEAQRYVCDEAKTLCLAAVHKALADWPQVPSESTKRFAAMVIANIEGGS